VIVDSGAFLALLTIAAVALGLWTRRRITGVPLRMSLTQPGVTRVHRRLHDDLAGARRAVGRARRAGFPTQGPTDVLADAEHRVRDLDARLFAASRRPFFARRRELVAVRGEAADLRAVATRVEQLADDLVTPPASVPTPRELHRRLDVFDAARREAYAVSRRWGGTGSAAT
jgi:hypothetical protein